MATASVAPIHPARKVSDFVAHSATVRCAQIGAKSGQLVVSGGDDSAVNIWRIGHAGSLRVSWRNVSVLARSALCY
jgi:anaerobic glycerol-3-phosphate dehydrogenase